MGEWMAVLSKASKQIEKVLTFKYFSPYFCNKKFKDSMSHVLGNTVNNSYEQLIK